MKAIVHKADTRGVADHGWLSSHHSFSFASYYNPKRMGFGLLRVLNDDIVDPSMGFPTHPHHNMEIISIPLSGSLRHKDSEGNQTVIKPGEVQLMSAGTGVLHSEYNDSDRDPVNFLQIWVKPEQMNIKPRYDQAEFSIEERKNRFQLVVSPWDKYKEGLKINQQAYFSLADLDQNTQLEYDLENPENGLYLFVLEGSIEINNEILNKRDAMGIQETPLQELTALKKSSILVIEVPMK